MQLQISEVSQCGSTCKNISMRKRWEEISLGRCLVGGKLGSLRVQDTRAQAEGESVCMLLVPPPLACCLASTDRVVAFMTASLSKRADSVAVQRCSAGCRLRRALPGEGRSPFQEKQAPVPGEKLILCLPMLRLLGRRGRAGRGTAQGMSQV